MAGFIGQIFELLGKILQAIFSVIYLFFKLIYDLIVALKLPDLIVFIALQVYALLAMIFTTIAMIIKLFYQAVVDLGNFLRIPQITRAICEFTFKVMEWLCRRVWDLLSLLFECLWRGFKCFYDHLLFPILRGLANLAKAFWKALVIVGGYVW